MLKLSFFLNKLLRSELNIFTAIFSNTEKFRWETPTRYLIETDYECSMLGDTCPDGEELFVMTSNFGTLLIGLKKLRDRLLKLK